MFFTRIAECEKLCKKLNAVSGLKNILSNHFSLLGNFTMLFRIFVFGLLLCALQSNAESLAGQVAGEVVVSSGLSEIPLVSRSQIFKDKDNSLTDDDFLKHKGGGDSPSGNPFVSFGFSRAAYWFYVPLKNPESTAIQKLLVFEPTWLDDIQVTLIQSGTKIQQYKGGDSLPFNRRAILNQNINFNLVVPPGESQLLVRVKSRDPVDVSMTLYERSAFFEADAAESKFLGLTYGVLGALLLYNLFLFFSIRETTYIAYASYLFSFLIMHATLNGRSYQVLWPESPVLNNWLLAAFVYLYMLAGLYFAILFLELRSKLFTAYRLAMGFALLLVTTYLVTAVFGGYGGNILSATVLVIVYGPLIVFLGAWSLRSGNRAARFFLIGTVSGFIGSCITPLTTSGIIPFTFFTYRAVDFGMVIDAIMLSFALADRIAFARREKDIAQEKLKVNDERWRLALESAGEGVWDWNIPSGEVVYSKRWKEMLGYSEDEIPNKIGSWESLIYPLDKERTLSNIQSFLSVGNKGYRNEFRMLCKDGSWKWILAQGAIVERDDKEKPVRIIGTHTDISETKRLEESVRNINEKLELRVEQRTRELAQAKDAAELASLSKTRFLASAGHDLRQPVAAAILFVEALKFTSPSQRQNELIDQLDQSMSTFSNLLERLLDISKFDAGLIKPELAVVNLAKVFDWLNHNFAQTALNKQLRFRLFLDLSQPLIVRTDIGLLQSVLMNLVSNAIKFTSHGGILISARVRGDRVLLQIWDTGVGMAPDYLPHIFDEFYQVSNQQRSREAGLGLGLSICQRAMMLLGDKVTCRSRLGHGSVFELSLALYSAQSPAESLSADHAAEKTVDDSFVQNKRVVAIEDDELVARGLIKLLQGLGADVLHFSNAEEALNSPEIINADYFIVDYMLGGELNGIQFLNLLRQKKGKNINAVLVTGDTSPAFIHEAANCDWLVLHKPVNISKLFSALRSQQDAFF